MNKQAKLLTAAAILLLCVGAFLHWYFSPIPALSHPNDAKVLSIDGERDGILVNYILPESEKTAILDILAQATMVRTVRKSTGFAYGDYTYHIVIRDGTALKELLLGNESKVQGSVGSPSYILENNNQVLSEISRVIESDSCVIE